MIWHYYDLGLKKNTKKNTKKKDYKKKITKKEITKKKLQKKKNKLFTDRQTNGLTTQNYSSEPHNKVNV